MDEEIQLPWMLENNRWSPLVFNLKVPTYSVSKVRSAAIECPGVKCQRVEHPGVGDLVKT